MEFLHIHDAEVRLKPLKVRFRIACVMHKIADILVARVNQLDLDSVRFRDPLGVLELRVGDRGSLSDPSPFAVLVRHALWWCLETHTSEEYEVQ